MGTPNREPQEYIGNRNIPTRVLIFYYIPTILLGSLSRVPIQVPLYVSSWIIPVHLVRAFCGHLGVYQRHAMESLWGYVPELLKHIT